MRRDLELERARLELERLQLERTGRWLAQNARRIERWKRGEWLETDLTDQTEGLEPPLIASLPKNTGGRMRAVASVPETTDEQATRFVIERNQLQKRVGEIAAAWDVWAEAQHTVRQLARRNEWAGDLPDGGQRQQLKEQFNAQIFEAYARARVQCAIVLSVDDLDTVADFDRHWEETWGAPTLTKAAAVYAEQIAAARARQHESRAAAAAQSDAFDAAGVLPRERPADRPAEAAPTVPPPARGWAWWPIRRP
jgi:hypothetical protein